MSDPGARNVVIAGAGPAGLTAAYELASRSSMRVTVFEESDAIGGISRTVCHNGNRMDIGGHRFFSKNERVTQWWESMMPFQNTTDPDRVMLRRPRVSRIYYLRRFFDYPVRLSAATILNLGLWRTLKCGAGYAAAMLRKRKERSLEDFYINRFGAPLYRMFFEDYTEKVWGKHPSQLGADWGSQRVKGLSITTLLKSMARKRLGKSADSRKVETSLIEEFLYPKFGPGQLWETVAEEAQRAGARIRMQSRVKRIRVKGHRVEFVVTEDIDGKEHEHPCDIFISSMPIKDLISALEGIDIPQDVKTIAATLPYRDFITVGLLVDRLRVAGGRIPDTWIYVQERNVRLGRIQVFNNWSPYLVADHENKVWIGLEYFCEEGDALWEMSDSEFIDMAVGELASIGFIAPEDVEDAVRIRVKKAYPAYYGSYYQLDKVIAFLDSIDNLYCVGRNGQHRYNNMDHSMLTAMEAADAILAGTADRRALWTVNTEKDYHEFADPNPLSKG